MNAFFILIYTFLLANFNLAYHGNTAYVYLFHELIQSISQSQFISLRLVQINLIKSSSIEINYCGSMLRKSALEIAII